MSTIFMSYRREDTPAMTGRIYDRLVLHYGADSVFKDVDSIPAGTDFSEYIQREIKRATIQLIIIGPHWIEATDPTGQRRLDQPADFLRLEIEAGLKSGIPVLPLLVDGAIMPPPEQLPESLARLSRLQAISVRYDPDFAGDMRRVMAAIERLEMGGASESAAATVPPANVSPGVSGAYPVVPPGASTGASAAPPANTQPPQALPAAPQPAPATLPPQPSNPATVPTIVPVPGSGTLPPSGAYPPSPSWAGMPHPPVPPPLVSQPLAPGGYPAAPQLQQRPAVPGPAPAAFWPSSAPAQGSIPAPVQHPMPQPHTSGSRNRPLLISGIVAAGLVVLVAIVVVCSVTASALGTLGRATATATEQATATPTTPVPTDTPASVSTPVSGLPYTKTLASYTPGWGEDSNCSFQNGGYTISYLSGQNDTIHECFSPLSDVADAYVSVQVVQVRGITNQDFGIAFRRDASSNTAYAFGISSNGQWEFYESFPGSSISIVQWKVEPAIHTGLGSSNIIAVRFQGTHFIFFINGTQIGAADNGELATGQTGLFVTGGQEAVFTNFSGTAP